MNDGRRQLVEDRMRELTATLHEQLIDTSLVTVAQWNKHIAPRLSALSMAVEGVSVTARTYRISRIDEEQE